MLKVFVLFFFSFCQLADSKGIWPITLTTQQAVADTKQAVSSGLLLTALNEIKKSSASRLDVQKLVKSEIMQKETLHEGHFIISKGSFYWELQKPEKSLLVYNGKTVWNVSFPDEGMDIPIQVIKTTVKDKKQIPLAGLLWAKEPVTTLFNVTVKSQKDDDVVFSLKQKKEMGLSQATITVSAKTKKILSIEYEDDVGNLTRVKVLNTKRNIKIKKDQFEYVPPKGAQITEV